MNAAETAVIDGGEAQLTEVDLSPGSYALLCFIPDRAGGPPRVAKGMISEAKVRADEVELGVEPPTQEPIRA